MTCYRKFEMLAVVALVILGVITRELLGAPAQVYNNAQCVASINGGTCGDTGDSICSYLYQQPDGCDGAGCTNCPGNAAVPETYCVNLEGHTCTSSGAPVSPCANVIEQVGTCLAADGDCTCTNYQPGNRNCSMISYVPCTL
jgi:hypothetical protein